MTYYPAKWGPTTGRQVILKSDFVDLWEAIGEQPAVRLQPPLIWEGIGSVKIAATSDCPVSMQFTGMPNILHPFTQVSGGLSDGNIRTVSADVSMNFAASGLYGGQDEKNSQWYGVFALAADDDDEFELKALPIMRALSNTGKAVKCGTNITPGTGIDYAFTDDELVGGILYCLSGTNAGKMRTISANDVDTYTRITYTVGDELTFTEGDWFIVLPPSTNFRLVGTIYNSSGGDIVKFVRLGNSVWWLESVSGTPVSGENVVGICPLASHILYIANGSATTTIAYKGYTVDHNIAWTFTGGTVGRGPVVFCEVYINAGNWGTVAGYEYQPSCGF